MPNVAVGALTRKIGPLPAWGWGVAVGGALLVFTKLRGGGGGGGGASVKPSGMAPTAYTPDTSQQGFLEGLGASLAALSSKVDDLQNVPAPQTTPIAGVVAPNPPQNGLYNFGPEYLGNIGGAIGRTISRPVSLPQPKTSAYAPISAKPPTTSTLAKVVAPVKAVAAKFVPSSYMSPAFPAAKVSAAIKAATSRLPNQGIGTASTYTKPLVKKPVVKKSTVTAPPRVGGFRATSY
jgi:hypothetical protein